MNGSTWVGRSGVKTLGVSSDARLRYSRQPSGTDYGTPASHGKDDGTDTLQNQRMRLARRWRRRRSYPRGHHHGEPDPGTGPEWLLEVIQPGYILLLTALDRMGRDTCVSSDGQDVDLRVLDMPVLAKEVAVISPRMPGVEWARLKGTSAGSAGLSHRLGYAL